MLVFPIIDINECLNDTVNNCDQLCNNNAGSYTCSCMIGYALDDDGITCIGIVIRAIVLQLSDV